MKTTNMIKYISIVGLILTVILELIKTGGDGTAVILVLITAFLFIAASIKTRIFQKKDNTEKM